MTTLIINTFEGYLDSVDVRSAATPSTLITTVSGAGIVSIADGIYSVDVGAITGQWILVLKDVDGNTLGIKYASDNYTNAADDPPWIPTSSVSTPVYVPTSYSGLLFTSIEEMRQLFSEVAIEVRTDDFVDDQGDPDPQAIADMEQKAVIRATYRCKSILNRVYNDVDLAQNEWVRERATIIGCYLISIRRGNPAQYADMAMEAMEEMQALVDGELVLIDLPRSQYASVAIQNIHSDNRQPFAPTRIDIQSSSQVFSGQSFQYYIPFGWI